MDDLLEVMDEQEVDREYSKWMKMVEGMSEDLIRWSQAVLRARTVEDIGIAIHLARHFILAGGCSRISWQDTS